MSSYTTGSAGSAEILRPRPEDGAIKAAPESTDTVPVEEPHKVPDLPVPTMGFPAFIHSINKSINPEARPPKLSKKERALLDAREEEARLRDEHAMKVERYQASIRQLRQLTDKVGRATIAFFGVSGSAATTTNTVNAVSVFSELTRTIVACSDFNPANGTAGARLKKDYDETLTVREFRRLIKEKAIDSPSELTSLLRPTVNGVRVLCANDSTSEAGAVEATVLEEMLDLIRQVFEFHYVDTANDTTTASMRKILEDCDMPVFTANVKERKSLQLLGTSMEIARKTPGMRDKTNNSVVVISNLSEGEKLDDYRKFLNRVNIHEQETSRYEFYGQVLPIREATCLAENAPVDLKQMRWDTTLQEYIDLNIAVLEQILLYRADNGRGVAQ